MKAVQRESNELVFCLCMRVKAIILVNQFPMVGVSDDFGSDVAEREVSYLWGGIREFCSVKR